MAIVIAEGGICSHLMVRLADVLRLLKTRACRFKVLRT
jgi:hypothetical protein